MASRAALPPHQRRFAIAATVGLGSALLFFVLLNPALPLATRQVVSAAGLLISGAGGTVSGAIKACR